MKILCSFVLVFLATTLFSEVSAAQSSGNITTQNLVAAGKATEGSCVELDVRDKGAATVQVSGTYTGALSLQRTNDGAVWETLTDTSTFKDKAGTTTATIASAATGTYLVSGVTGFYKLRLCGLAAVTGSAAVALQSSVSGGSSGGGAGGGDASASNQTSGAAKTQVVDGSGNVIGATANALDVNIKSGASSGAVAQGSTTSGQTGGLTQAAVTTAAPSYTTAQTSPLSLTTAGAMRIDINSVAATTISSGNGAAGSGTLRVALANDSTGIGIVTETAPASDTASSGLNGRLQRVAQNLTTLNTSVNTDPTYLPTATAKIDVSTATTTQIVAASGAFKVKVAAFSIIAGGTGNIKFVYGTGSNCGTGTTDLTASYNLTAQSGLAMGAGLGIVLITPASQALCVTTSAAVQMSGFVTYAQN